MSSLISFYVDTTKAHEILHSDLILGRLNEELEANEIDNEAQCRG